jgi:hypothetical protein
MKIIKEKLIESALDETGIKLNSNDFQLTTDSGNLTVSLWDYELINMPYSDGDLDDEDFAEEVWKELFREHFDLREKIIELKLEDLNSKHLPKISEDIIAKLEDNKIDETLLDTLDFEFVDLGYNNGNFTNPGEEEWNYSHIALRVTDYEEMDHHITIDPYKDPATFDHASMSNEIIKKIRGKI